MLSPQKLNKNGLMVPVVPPIYILLLDTAINSSQEFMFMDLEASPHIIAASHALPSSVWCSFFRWRL